MVIDVHLNNLPQALFCLLPQGLQPTPQDNLITLFLTEYASGIDPQHQKSSVESALQALLVLAQINPFSITTMPYDDINR